ncbi:hypothetical protein SUNI508_11951 [Seiridium unicorne]|uniref:Uncharacterized protein n=1 Tax=Seiridium unicorne TaxID=138068 RepID=A0ABR2UFD4_9PEZI
MAHFQPPMELSEPDRDFFEIATMSHEPTVETLQQAQQETADVLSRENVTPQMVKEAKEMVHESLDYLKEYLKRRPILSEAFQIYKSALNTANELATMETYGAFDCIFQHYFYGEWKRAHYSKIFCISSSIGEPELQTVASAAVWNSLKSRRVDRVRALVRCRGGSSSNLLDIVRCLILWVIMRGEAGNRVRRDPRLLLSLLSTESLDILWGIFVRLVDCHQSFTIILDGIHGSGGNDDASRLISLFKSLTDRPGPLHPVVKVFLISQTKMPVETIGGIATLMEISDTDVRRGTQVYFKEQEFLAVDTSGWHITAPGLAAAKQLGGGPFVGRLLLRPVAHKQSLAVLTTWLDNLMRVGWLSNQRLAISIALWSGYS